MVLRRTGRSAVRSGALWGVVFGAFVASSALGYAASYPSLASRRVLARTFGNDAGIDGLLGPARHIESVAGFTAWRTLVLLAVLGGVWGLLAATRLLRGEEDAGRWEVMLAGPTDRRRAAAQAVAGLGAGVLVLWVITAILTVASGRSSDVRVSVGAALFFSVALVAGAAVFTAAGALASQLASTRRQAAAFAGVALGVSYGIRVIADSGSGLSWLRWLSPVGWIEELQPLTSPHPWPLVPLVGLVVGLAGMSVVVAGRRDLGAGVVADRTTATARTRWLSGPVGLTLRIGRGAMIGWAIAIGATSLLLGVVAKSAGSALNQASGFEAALERLGARASGAAAYVGVSFLVVAALIAVMVAGHLTSARSEEAEGRLDHLVSRPVARRRWLAGRVAVALVAAVGAGLLAGVGSWLGAASQDTGLAASRLLEAGLNVVAPAILLIGLGVLTLGLRPRWVAVVAYGYLGWSLLLELVGGVVQANHWLLDTSMFHHLTPAPAAPPDWASAVALAVVGLSAAVVGGLAFERRDLVGA
jgi:ABC-2 type transport system permease protein